MPHPISSTTAQPRRSFAHARQRARERYGLILSASDMAAIADRIARSSPTPWS
jgi:hypothetical protein